MELKGRRKNCRLVLRHPHSFGGLLSCLLAVITIALCFGWNAAAGNESGPALSRPLIVRWQYDSDATVNLTPATDGLRVYLPLANGNLLSLNTTNGQLIWKTEMGGELSASPTADEVGVYIATEIGGTDGKEPRAKGTLRALGREGGVTLWMRTFPMPIRGALAMSETLLFGGAEDGRIYAVRKATGEIAWITQYQASFVSHPATAGQYLYLGSEDGSLLALDQVSGKILWRYRTRGGVRGSVAMNGGAVFFGSADGYVYALSEADGSLLWRTRTGAAVQTVALTQTGLLAASLDNFVYKLSMTNGKRLWKRQLAGRPLSEPLTAPDGVLFTPLSGDEGIILDLRDGRPLNAIPLGDENSNTASPISVGKFVFVTTRRGLLAFSNPD